MFCKYCGASIDDDALFCQKCGKKLASSSAEKTEECAQESIVPKEEIKSQEIAQEKEKTEFEQLLGEESENHSAEIQYKIGECYYLGKDGAIKDLAKAAEWFEKAAYQGHANAKSKIGAMSQDGTGVEKDIAKAKQWYKMAANNGVMFAKIALEKLEQEENARKPKHFCKNCGKEIAEGTRFCQYCGTDQQSQSYTYSASSNIASSNISSASSPKSKTTLLVLFFLLNSIGAHYFYVGRTGLGVIRLCVSFFAGFFTGFYNSTYDNTSLALACALGIGEVIWWIFEIVAIVKNQFKDCDGKFISD